MVPHRGGALGLDVPLVHRLGAELSFHHKVGLLETFVHVTQLELLVSGDIGLLGEVVVEAGRGHVLVKDRGIRFHRVFHGHHRWQHLVVDLDQLQRRFGFVGVLGGHRGYRMSFVQDLVPGQNVVAEVFEAQYRVLTDLGQDVGYFSQVFGGDHGQHARMGLGGAGVDGLNLGVSVGAA